MSKPTFKLRSIIWAGTIVPLVFVGSMLHGIAVCIELVLQWKSSWRPIHSVNPFRPSAPSDLQSPVRADE